MNEKKIWYLQQIDLFAGIPDEEIMTIANKMVEKKCSKKELLYTPHESNNFVCVLKKGEVTLYNSHRGRKLIIDVLKPGSIFGNIGFEKEKNNHFAEATQDSYICIFPVEEFLKIVQAKPQIMLKLLKIMSNRLKEYEDRLKGGLFDAKEKIIHHLKILEKKRAKGFLNRLIGKPTKITHEILAQNTGLSRETVSRAISDLKKEGLIKTDYL